MQTHLVIISQPVPSYSNSHPKGGEGAFDPQRHSVPHPSGAPRPNPHQHAVAFACALVLNHSDPSLKDFGAPQALEDMSGVALHRNARHTLCLTFVAGHQRVHPRDGFA